jgi:hypothetical protein
MKKILLIIACIVGVFSFVSCSDDDDKSTSDSTIAIVKSDVKFTSNPGEGYIEFTSPTTVTASSSEEWCTASVNGSKVVVDVTANTDLEGRNAVVTISAGGSSISVPVSQSGRIFRVKSDGSYIVAGVGADKETISTKSSNQLSASSDADWVHASVEDGRIVVSFDDNDGSPRTGLVNVTDSYDTKSVRFVQLSSNNDIDGDYAAYYLASTSASSWSGKYVTLTVADNGYDINGLMKEGSLPLRYDDTTGYLALANGSYIGQNETTGRFYYACNSFISTSSGSVAYATVTGYGYNTYYDIEVMDDGSIGLYMDEFSHLTGYESFGPYIMTFSEQEFSKTYLKSIGYRFIYLQLYSL